VTLRLQRRSGRRVAAWSAIVAAGLAGVRPAMGLEPGVVTRAEALFREGKALLEQREYERACPLLSASFALDPGTGVLLALAVCHEAEGKLASASADYDEVAARAAREGRADRERVARERGPALRTQASTLTIVAPADAPLPAGFVARTDGADLDASSLGAPVPVDGGDHVIEASAAGKKPWLTRIRLAPTGDHRVVVIPALEDVPVSTAVPAAPLPVVVAASPSPAPPSLVRQAAPPTIPTAGTSRLRVAGVALMATGAAAFGVGTFFGLRAMLKNEDSKQGCPGNVCNSDGNDERLAALSAANTATVAFAAGAATAAVGAALYLMARRTAASRGGAPTALGGRVEVGGGGARFLLEVALGR
jgi:hypothetical protein